MAIPAKNLSLGTNGEDYLVDYLNKNYLTKILNLVHLTPLVLSTRQLTSILKRLKQILFFSIM